MAEIEGIPRAQIYNPYELERLRNAHVAIVGNGGVAGAITRHLTGFGIGYGEQGSITAIDPDTVSTDNLFNLVYSTKDNVGMPKPEALKNDLFEKGPFTPKHFYTHNVGISEENAKDLLSQVQPTERTKRGEAARLIIDATAIEGASLGATIARVAREWEVPVFTGMSDGYLGSWASTFHPNGPKFEEAYLGIKDGSKLPISELSNERIKPNVLLPFVSQNMQLRDAIAMAFERMHPNPSPMTPEAFGPQIVANIIGGQNHRRMPVYFRKVLYAEGNDGVMHQRNFNHFSFYPTVTRMAVRSVLGMNPQVDPESPTGIELIKTVVADVKRYSAEDKQLQ